MSFNLSSLTKPVARLAATAQNGLEVLRLGGLETGSTASSHQIVESVPMYRLRRYFAPGSSETQDAGPVVLMVHPMMMAADMWDVTQDGGAVGILHRAGIDPWVVDFGSPDRMAGGMERTLSDHVVAVSDAIETVHRITGRQVHLAGYSQGGMFCYQTAALRKSRTIASIITFGSPVDATAAMPMGMPAGLSADIAEFMADHVFSRFSIPAWSARIGFQMLDPVKTIKGRLDFLRQLHDRDALLPREQQRKFLANEGWIAWSGPAIAELLRQFVVHNRMTTGGFTVNDRVVTLSDITCPVLAVVGEVDDIGQPASVRGILRAAPKADVYEFLIRAGHFGLVVGSTAVAQTWPTVSQWVQWREGEASKPPSVDLMYEHEVGQLDRGGVPLTSRVAHGLSTTTEVAITAARTAGAAAAAANKSVKSIAVEAVRTLPRLTRLGQIHDHTRISMGRLMTEQARRTPHGECFLFDGRVHTYEAVDRRINNVVKGLIEVGVRQGVRVGILMETRPSALVAIAALSRLGAVAVLLPPDADLEVAVKMGEISELLTDPPNLPAAHDLPVHVLVLGGGESRELSIPDDGSIIDMEKIDPDLVELPGWYRPDPGQARDLAFVMFSGTGTKLLPKQITNHRWALSAFGTASAATLSSNDTVYCLTPLHHQSGLLVSIGGAVAGGARIALSRGLDPDRFVQEVHQYGVSVVSYTWAMMNEVIDDPALALGAHHPVRLFIGSGMPAGLWRRVTEKFDPAHVVEFFATTDGEAVLANVSGTKVGSKGRPLPGGGRVRLAAYDPIEDVIIEGEDGFVQIAEPGEVGLLLAKPPGDVDSTAAVRRGVFAPGDTWVSSEFLFRRDEDGDFWMLDGRGTAIRNAHGVVYAEATSNALGALGAIDLVATYPVEVGETTVAVTAVVLRPGEALSPADLAEAFVTVPISERPDIIKVVPNLPLNASYRPSTTHLRAFGLPKPGRQTWHLDSESGSYHRLTAATYESLQGAAQ
ncbi:putative long chain acyl-CoA synthase [Mycobacteroides chelonae]|nr:putative long chain acyl-CoA synthase [Mycobacteroides chelonae]